MAPTRIGQVVRYIGRQYIDQVANHWQSDEAVVTSCNGTLTYVMSGDYSNCYPTAELSVIRESNGTIPGERQDLSVWVDSNGGGIPFKDMTTAHLMNVVAMLYRREGGKNTQRSKLVTLEKELLRRLKEQYAST